jgi:hypothetical protein
LTIKGSNTCDGVNKFSVAGGPISCQDVALPKGYDTEDKLILLIRSVYDGFKFCRDVRFSKIMSAG